MTNHELYRGSTLLIPGTHGNPEKLHFCIILTNPRRIRPHQTLYVPVITMHPKYDSTCILNVGDHPFITHESCVDYARAQVQNAAHMLKLGIPKEPLIEPELERVCNGIVQSPFSPPFVKSFYIENNA